MVKLTWRVFTSNWFSLLVCTLDLIIPPVLVGSKKGPCSLVSQGDFSLNRLVGEISPGGWMTVCGCLCLWSQGAPNVKYSAEHRGASVEMDSVCMSWHGWCHDMDDVMTWMMSWYAVEVKQQVWNYMCCNISFFVKYIFIFLTKGSNLGLSHYRQILYHLSHQGRPYI